jgi:hypothetical protein
MPKTLTGFRTRSPVITQKMLNVSKELKGIRFFTSNSSTDVPDRSSEIVAQELTRLREYSEQNKKPGFFNAYLEAMRLVNRKTLPLCKYHHNLVHSGEYDGESLSNLFESF